MSRDFPSDPRLSRFRRLRDRVIAQAQGASERPVDDRHPLVKAIGLDEAKAILSPDPTPIQARWAARRAIVAKRIAEGAAIKQIARELNVSPTRIRQLRKALGL